ncbi:MAG: hypothetical protein K2L79_02370 [Bacteroidales bacterium]|nr:hypothetical protein [Bacteroidales bacterium]
MSMKRVNPYSFLVGLLFVVSAIAKACDAAAFAETIVRYGFPRFSFLAPFIIIIEFLLGGLLILRTELRYTIPLAFGIVLFFTIMYSYALIFEGNTDCGCFGPWQALNASPLFLYIRNAVLLILLFFAYLKREKYGDFTPGFRVLAPVLVGAGVLAFFVGYTYQEPVSYKTTRMALHDSVLSEFVETSPDSTYLVFAFSYTCPHCLNSIGNLKECARFPVADKVIGLALGDSVMENRFFRKIFEPNFIIHNHKKELLRLTEKFPRTYYIRHDSIVLQMSGELPCPFIFSAHLD